MIADLPPVRELDGVELIEVRDEATHRTWAATLRKVYEFPAAGELGWLEPGVRTGWRGLPWRMWFARLEEEPVGAVLLFEDPRVATLFGVGVLPEARRRGIGSLLTLAPLAEAHAALAGFWSTPDGAKIYRPMGFRPAGCLNRWLWLPPAMSGAAEQLDVARGRARPDGPA